jgi:5'-nucleotidase / UDP-sugar diphosphatase
MEIVDRYKNLTDAILDEVIGEAQVDLQGKGSYAQETNLGNLVADVLRQETKADVALTNGGGIRADITKGSIRMKDLFTVLPFSNYPVVLKVTGQELKAIFEYGLTGPERSGGGFPQASGIRLTYAPVAPEGQRIKEFQVGGKPLDSTAWYSLATIDFLAAGGDGYTIIKNLFEFKERDSTQTHRVLLLDSSRMLRDLVIKYIKENKRVSASVEGRIQKEK